MNAFGGKLKLVYLPFLGIAVGCICLATFLNWILTVVAQAVLPWSLFDFFFPFLFPWLPIMLWMRRRVSLFRENTKKNNRSGLYFIMWLSIGIPSCISQYYIQRATGKLTQLHSISQINQLPATKYYALQHYYIDTISGGYYYYTHREGRGQGLHYHAEIALPICDSLSAPFSRKALYWLDIQYDTPINKRLPEETKDSLWNQFIADSKEKIKHEPFNFTFLERLNNGYGRIDDITAAAKKSCLYENDNSLLFFTPENGAYENRTGNSFYWIFGSLGIGSLAIFLFFLFNDLDPDKLEKFRSRNERQV